jgi:D-alanyl-D-alanine carboxypeptidase
MYVRYHEVTKRILAVSPNPLKQRRGTVIVEVPWLTHTNIDYLYVDKDGNVQEYLDKELKIPLDQFLLVEGSGISRKNRLTPEAIWQLLKAFAPHQDLLQGDNDVLLKTGTLSGVYSMAGYLPGTNPLFFVILLNQPQNTRDKILKILLATDFSAGKF